MERGPTYGERHEWDDRDAVLRGVPTLTPPTDSIANMRVIDDIYRAAGMEPRRGATDS